MARCEVCGRKIPGTRRFCGEDECTAATVLPRCTKCRRIMFEGMSVCPKDRMVCTPDNDSVTIPTYVKYIKKVK